MDDSHYDEFGNYIGPDLPSSDEDEMPMSQGGIEDDEEEIFQPLQQQTSLMVLGDGNPFIYRQTNFGL